MEKIERKKSVDSDEKERHFFAINSLGKLIPVIFIIFFFAYLAGSQPSADSTLEIPKVSIEKWSETIIVEKQDVLKKEEKQEKKSYLNTSPIKLEAKTLPSIESTKKSQSIQKNIPTETEKDLARPIFPKASPREVLPTLEVSQSVDKIVPTIEKYSSTEIKSQDEIIAETKPVEEVNFIYNTPLIKEQSIEVLKRKDIASLAEVAIEIPEMTVKSNWVPRTSVREENELILAGVSPEIEEEKVVEALDVVKYNSSDFKWEVNNHSHGVKQSAIFTNTPDGKASYCSTDAGIVLKVNNLANIDSSSGIFVEKSEDGEEYNSIGIINAENASELLYFDAEYSFDGAHHYRFRSTSTEGNDLQFGKVSVIRRASISPVLSQVNAKGKYNLILDSKSTESVAYEIKEAWGGLNSYKGTKELVEGENELSFDLAGDPGLYFLTISTANQNLDLLIEKPGISPDLSFYDQEVSGKQSFNEAKSVPFLIENSNSLSFDFYLKNGGTLIFNKGEYNSETVKIKKAKIGTLPETLQARHSDEMLWFTASANISYLHQKVPVILEHNKQEIAAQINIFASKNTIRPISHFSSDSESAQKEWRIPGLKSCPNIDLMVFNDWGNLIYQTENVTEENIWNGKKDDEKLPEGMYYYVLGHYGGWVQLER